MNNKTANTFHRGDTSSFYSKCCNLQITHYMVLQKDVTNFKCLYLSIIYEKQNCNRMSAEIHVEFLFQVLQLTNYRLQGASKDIIFQVLVSQKNLRITKLQTHTIRDTRQIFIPSDETYKF
jgi:hypothetical protein